MLPWRRFPPPARNNVQARLRRGSGAIVAGSNVFAVEALNRAALLAHRQACE
jgi:hypothetical protein